MLSLLVVKTHVDLIEVDFNDHWTLFSIRWLIKLINSTNDLKLSILAIAVQKFKQYYDASHNEITHILTESAVNMNDILKHRESKNGNK